MSTTLSTHYAPSERATPEEVLRQSRYFAAAAPLLRQFLNAVPDIITVLNGQRQIVFANQRLLDYLNVSLESVIGLRPGEAINCVHAFESECGCGTSEFCATCGAVQAILACQRGTGAVQDCRIIQRLNGEALDLRVWTTPVEAEGELYTIFAATDISHEKRRQALERIFFHDVLNAASVLTGSIMLLQEQQDGQPDELMDLVGASAGKLVDEIKAQQILTQAENNELTLRLEQINIRHFLQHIVNGYRLRHGEQQRQMQLVENAGDVQLISDRVLLGRVIGNMVKNAVEVNRPGETITLGYEQQDNQIEIWVHNPNLIPRHVQLQIFQRSFSTKGSGRGLGTYSMKLLGERYLQGTVTFSSSAEEGTTFRLRCPTEISLHNAASL